MPAAVRKAQKPHMVRFKKSELSRTKLLHAAERLVIEKGVASLTIRRIAEVSGVNSQLIGYYFGGIDQLTEELLWLNLDPMLEEREQILSSLANQGRPATIDQVMEAFLRPMWRQAAHCPNVHANVVVSEIVNNGPDAAREKMMEKINVAYHALADAFRPLLSHISHSTLLWRICCISGSVVAVTPRLYSPRFFSPLDGELPEFTNEQWYRELFAFAKGAITAPPP